MNPFNPKHAAKSGRKNIFISYRVSDTSGETGRLVDSLKEHFYEDQIFMDIDKLEPGIDFTKVISNSLEACDVMLVIIGPNWLGRNSDGTTHISKTNDWVRMEVVSALKRDIRVVPVLVDNASLPEPEDVPEDLHPLLTRQSFEISNKRWRYDTGQLIEFLKRAIGIQPKPGPGPLPVQKPLRTNPVLWILSGVGLVAILIIIIAVVFYQDDEQLPNPKPPVGENVVDNIVDNGTEVAPVIDQPAVITPTGFVSGVWLDANGLYYLDIIQNGNRLTVRSYNMDGVLTAEGNGYMSGNDFHANLNTVAVGMITFESTLSGDGSVLRGKTSYTSNGVSFSDPVVLNKTE